MQVCIPSDEMCYRVPGTELQSHVAVCDCQFIIPCGDLGVRAEPVPVRCFGVQQH